MLVYKDSGKDPMKVHMQLQRGGTDISSVGIPYLAGLCSLCCSWW